MNNFNKSVLPQALDDRTLHQYETSDQVASDTRRCLVNRLFGITSDMDTASRIHRLKSTSVVERPSSIVKQLQEKQQQEREDELNQQRQLIDSLSKSIYEIVHGPLQNTIDDIDMSSKTRGTKEGRRENSISRQSSKGQRVDGEGPSIGKKETERTHPARLELLWKSVFLSVVL